jgi:hypothetical protein
MASLAPRERRQVLPYIAPQWMAMCLCCGREIELRFEVGVIDLSGETSCANCRLPVSGVIPSFANIGNRETGFAMLQRWVDATRSVLTYSALRLKVMVISIG